MLRAHWEQFWQTLRNFFAKIPKIDKSGPYTAQKISRRCASGRLLCSLENALEKFCHFPIVFVSKSEEEKRINFF